MESFSADTGVAGDIPFKANISLPKFNTGLGTLTGVTITLFATTSGEVDVFNNTSATQSFTNAMATIPVMVTGPAGTEVSVTLSKTVPSGTVGAHQLNVTPITPVINSDTESTTSDLGMWEGDGQPLQLTLSFEANGTYGGTGPLQVFFGGNAAGSAETTVQYTYQAVPEPSAFCLLAGGLAMLFLLRHRRGAGRFLSRAVRG